MFSKYFNLNYPIKFVVMHMVNCQLNTSNLRLQVLCPFSIIHLLDFYLLKSDFSICHKGKRLKSDRHLLKYEERFCVKNLFCLNWV